MQINSYQSRRSVPQKNKPQTKSRLAWLVVIAAVFLLWFWPLKTSLERQYEELAIIHANQSNVVATAEIGGSKLHIPDWSLFSDGNLWSLVNREAKLSPNFTPRLVTAPIDHTGSNMRVAVSMVPKLKSLYAAAAKDGVKLMLSSAYRSVKDQQEIYNSYLTTRGQAYVDSYVALPGTSEHQTGLAVDISSYSSECRTQAAACSLDFSAITWLRNNAADYGFIQRYPAGKQSITGVAGEAWHYRYVGTELANLLTANNLTLDEFVNQIAPGYAK